ncbi:hypothetical protein E1B28_002072 [Marasmius oreades]|uniref:Uncharacterized protein n=1 Tax=Marasmius oreades TaxID=181124 RepID=A0A9P7V588_9AGAR|nr:uncharacterized protein E1B28_002072 [Marasmius oreades]KAG7100297.1 hypothetical protein E1B28_002072 [Marasmius oreades]
MSLFGWIFLAVFNISLLLYRHAQVNVWSPSELPYTYIGDDYPIELPIAQQLDLVAMTLQETTHYSLNASDPITSAEWFTLMNNPYGFGRVNLGSNHRLLTVVFWHQMHCISEMARAIMNRSHPEAVRGHIQHCLNYLRQSFLCDADYMLEAGDFMERDFERERVADTRVCRNWEAVMQDMEHRMEVSVEWRTLMA